MAESWCSTQIKTLKFSYMWTISNFSYCQEEMGEMLKSSSFSGGANDKWRLHLYPNGVNEESKDFSSLYLYLISSNKRELWVHLQFLVLNSHHETVHKMTSVTPNRFVPGKDWGFKKFMRRDVANGLLEDDKLTLYCKVTVIADPVNISGQNCAIQFKVPDCSFSEDIGYLFESQKFSDAILSVNGKEFHAHKAILAARSPVFAAMFEQDMEEDKQKEITDMEPHVLKEILEFIYTGKAPNLQYMSGKLLGAADKFALQRLKVMCEEELCQRLSVDSVCESLFLADLHNADQLKARALDFINSHGDVVMNTSGWKLFVEVRPHLLVDVLRTVNTRQVSLMDFQESGRRNHN